MELDSYIVVLIESEANYLFLRVSSSEQGDADTRWVIKVVSGVGCMLWKDWGNEVRGAAGGGGCKSYRIYTNNVRERQRT